VETLSVAGVMTLGTVKAAEIGTIRSQAPKSIAEIMACVGIKPTICKCQCSSEQAGQLPYKIAPLR
jgi:hypothetical protein